MSTPSEFFTISRVRDLTGLSMVTLTWIETELGDILQVRRTTGGNRLFTPTDVEHLKNIKRLMDEEGRSMAEAKALLFPDRFAPPAPTTTPDDTMAAPTRTPADTLPPKTEKTTAPTPGETVPGVPLAKILAGDPHQFESVDAEPGFAPIPMEEDVDSIPLQHSSHDTARDERPAAGTMEDEVGDSRSAEPDAAAPEAAGPTAVDVLLETAEGLVRENRKLRHSIDAIGIRLMRLEDALEEATRRSGRSWNPFRRA